MIAPKLSVHRKGGWVCEYVDGSQTIEAKGYSLRRKTGDRTSSISIGAPIWQRLGVRVDPIRRLFRLGIHGVDLLPDGGLIALVLGSFVHVDANGSSSRIIHRIQAGRRPLASGWLVDSAGRVVYGEYSPNKDNGEVKVWRSDRSLLNWGVVGAIPAGHARHIHTILENEDGSLLVATGDLDHESSVWQMAEDELRALEGGDQGWRMVALQRSDLGYIFGTDSPHSQNSIVSSPLDGSGRRSAEVEVDGPVYYTARIQGGLAFATTVERGSGEWDDWVTLWIRSSDGTWASRRVAQKDALSNRLFGHGVLFFPRGDLEGLEVLPVSVDGVRRRSIR